MQGNQINKYCNLCGENYKGEHYAKCNDFEILICKRCGLIWAYANPPFNSPLNKGNEVVSRFNLATTNYPSLEQEEEYWGKEVYISNAESQKSRFRKQIKTIIKKTGITNVKNIQGLEVGSGFGFFLDVCDEFGLKVEGCDISKNAIEYLNHNKERIRLGTLDSYYNDESFDIVFAFNLIEHLCNPKSFFIEAKRVLKQGGLLVLETPIQESLFHRIARLGYWLSNGKLKFFGISPEPNGHIYKFSKNTFKFICEDMGFEILYQKNINSPFGEIWGKSSIVSIDYKFIYRLSLPVVLTIAGIIGQGNRLYYFEEVIMRKRAGKHPLPEQ